MCDPGLVAGPMAAARRASDERTAAAITASLDAGLIGGDLESIALAARAAIYGLAHMIADGHLGEVDGARARELAMSVTEMLGAGFVNEKTGGR